MTLRKAVIDHYLSSSRGIHQPLSEAEADAYNSAYARYLQGWLPANPEAQWLDLACGQGHLMNLAHRALGYRRVTGVDLSPEMVAMARQQGYDVLEMDVHSALEGRADESVDVISCFDIIEHMPKEEGFRLMQLAFRALRPGGIMLLKLPNAYSPMGFGITANDLTHEAAYTEATILQMGTLAGFSQGNSREVGPQPHGVKSSVRWLLWEIVRRAFILYDMIETGTARSRIYTRVMLIRLQKARA